MTISSPSVKHILFDIIVFTDKLDAQGRRVPRAGWLKTHAFAASSLKDKLLDRVQFTDAIGKEWYYRTEFPDGFVPAVERFDDKDVTIEDNELSAVRYCYSTLEEIADYGPEALAFVQEHIANNS